MNDPQEACEVDTKPVDENVPVPLYRYRSIRGHGFERFEQTMTENKTWFSEPAEFNDPFECQFDLCFNASTEQKKRQYAQYLEARRGMKRKEARKKARAFFLGRSFNEISEWEHERWERLENKLRHETGVLCLSEIGDDILMWSHYADGHRGLCLVFEIQQDKEEHIHFFARAFKVRYQKTFPSFNWYLRDDQMQVKATPLTKADHWEEEQIKATVLTKADHWQYEQERRTIDMEKGPGPHRLPSGIISGVILGMNMLDADRKRVEQVARECRPSVALYEARRRPNSYALEIRPQSAVTDV